MFHCHGDLIDMPTYSVGRFNTVTLECISNNGYISESRVNKGLKISTGVYTGHLTLESGSRL